MGPAFETFLTVAGIVLAILVAAALLGRPVWRRIWRFLYDWYNADRLREEEERRQAALLAEAQREVTAWTDTEETPQPAQTQTVRQEQENR